MLSGCNYLDFDETSGLYKREDMYATFSNIKSMMTNIYGYMPNKSIVDVGDAMRECGSDDAEFGDPEASVQNFNNGNWSALSTLDTKWSLYNGIRSANEFLESYETIDLSIYQYDGKYDLEMERIKYYPFQARALRAYFLFDLARRYGDIPMPLKMLSIEEANSIEKTPFADVISFIVSECDDCIANLPVTYNGMLDNEYGRLTKGFAMALKAKALLYAASPLFNPSNDRSKWNKAYDASKKFIETYTQYSLFSNYEKLFNQNSGSANSEIIYGQNFTSTSSHQFPINNIGRRYGGYGGWWGSAGVSKELLDDYDMINGEPAFIWNGNEKTINPASGYDPQNPYANRDPRMDMCIIHDGSVFHGDHFEMWVSSDGTSWGKDNFHESSDNPVPNQQIRKFMPPDNIPMNWQEKYQMPWIHFRLGEIYLNFAEAAFELGKEDECREYVNKIRARVGMPGLPASVTGENLRQRLYNERRIELVFEEHRYFDLRRWKLASEVLNRPGHGIKIVLDKATGVKTYSDELLLDRKFYDTMYLLPIATEEILRNNGTLQQTWTWR